MHEPKVADALGSALSAAQGLIPSDSVVTRYWFAVEVVDYDGRRWTMAFDDGLDAERGG